MGRSSGVVDHSQFDYSQASRKGYLNNCTCAECEHRRIAIAFEWLTIKKLTHLLKDPFGHEEVKAYVHQFYEGGWEYFVKDKTYR